MFHRERWVSAFIGVLGENAEAGLACLKALAPPLRSVQGVFFGGNAAVKAERLLREAAASSGANGGGSVPPAALEYSIRFLALLVERNCLRRIDTLVRHIEKCLDRQKGILDLIAESAIPVDSAQEEELRRLVAERTGAAGIKMQVRIVPELLGGFRLRIGGFCLDASLKGQVENMTANLMAVSAPPQSFGAERDGGV